MVQLEKWLTQFPEDGRVEIVQAIEDEIRRLTRALRESEAPEYLQLREVLLEHGVDPSRSLLLMYWDEHDFFFGVIVTSDGRVLDCDLPCQMEPEYESLRTGPGPRWVGQARVRDVTGDVRGEWPEVPIALALLNSGEG
jgi:hypothetical protein